MWYGVLFLTRHPTKISKTRLSLPVAGALAMAAFASTRRRESPDFGLAMVASWKLRSINLRPLFRPWAAESTTIS